ncbi:MAG: 23S rRNA (pseudouridine(1915)-N(3))-methyltransferase RlmH [Paludibacteraceae bacterium]|nr:23S rRNA (pseudouridine(1915)-N(3))-methyltransferase RlmH [Paludibacteraceae bacterium]
MKIILILVGKTASSPLNEMLKDYEGRLKHYAPFQIEIIPDLRNTKNLSENEIKEKEGDLILKTLQSSDTVVLLDDKGAHFKSLEFASWLERKQNNVAKRLVFIIGGAYGFSKAIYNRANEKLSLSKMTFSHQLVRVIFAEQLYRAFTILNNEPYHHE